MTPLNLKELRIKLFGERVDERLKLETDSSISIATRPDDINESLNNLLNIKSDIRKFDNESEFHKLSIQFSHDSEVYTLRKDLERRLLLLFDRFSAVSTAMKANSERLLSEKLVDIDTKWDAELARLKNEQRRAMDKIRSECSGALARSHSEVQELKAQLEVAKLEHRLELGVYNCKLLENQKLLDPVKKLGEEISKLERNSKILPGLLEAEKRMHASLKKEIRQKTLHLEILIQKTDNQHVEKDDTFRLVCEEVESLVSDATRASRGEN